MKIIPPIEFYKIVLEKLLDKIRTNKERICAEFEKVTIDELEQIDRKLFELIEFHKKHWLDDLPSESKDVIQAIKDKKGANIFDKGNGFAKAYKNVADELEKKSKARH